MFWSVCLMKRCQKTTCFIGALGAVKNNEIIRREKGLKMKNKRYRKLHIGKISSLILSMQSKSARRWTLKIKTSGFYKADDLWFCVAIRIHDKVSKSTSTTRENDTSTHIIRTQSTTTELLNSFYAGDKRHSVYKRKPLTNLYTLYSNLPNELKH